MTRETRERRNAQLHGRRHPRPAGRSPHGYRMQQLGCRHRRLSERRRLHYGGGRRREGGDQRGGEGEEAREAAGAQSTKRARRRSSSRPAWQVLATRRLQTIVLRVAVSHGGANQGFSALQVQSFFALSCSTVQAARLYSGGISLPSLLPHARAKALLEALLETISVVHSDLQALALAQKLLAVPALYRMMTPPPQSWPTWWPPWRKG